MEKRLEIKKHLLIDGFELVFRSHFSHINFQTSIGLLSGCVYGFLVSLRAIKNKYPMYHVTITWDTNSTRKKNVYAEYKANRPKFEIIEQIEDLKNIFACVNCSQAELLGEEGDDILATLTRIYEGHKIVYSSDKDLLQLVKDGEVAVVTPKKVFDEEGVKNEFGVSPKNLACYLCLRGDAVDNIPGVPRVKSSLLADLSERFNTIQNIYDNFCRDDLNLTDFQFNSIRSFYKQAKINEELVILRKDLIPTIRIGIPNVDVFSTYLNKYEIKSISASSYIEIFNKSENDFNMRKSPMLEDYTLF